MPKPMVCRIKMRRANETKHFCLPLSYGIFRIMKDYLANHWDNILRLNGLDDFDVLWNMALSPVDRLNRRGIGWSSVSRLELKDDEGRPVAVFLKRQENYKFRSLIFPVFKIASFEREMRNLTRFREKDIPAAEPVYFAKRRVKGDLRAILIVASLDGYMDLNQCLELIQKDQTGFRKKDRLIKALADVLRRMHQKGFLHGAMFGKHVFVKGNDDFSVIDVRLIDLEFVRRHPDRALKDLSRLYMRTVDRNTHDCIRFLKYYMQQESANSEVRKMVSRIRKRVERKREA
jgi:tRNA A-37 threonylcarbamoyl transferase component Bud32